MNTVIPQHPVRHLGIYRTGVTLEMANLDCRVLVQLMRRGSLTRADLRQWLSGKQPTLQELQASLDRLAEWGMLEVQATGRVNSFTVHLTKTGEFWAGELHTQDRAAILATAEVTA